MDILLDADANRITVEFDDRPVIRLPLDVGQTDADVLAVFRPEVAEAIIDALPDPKPPHLRLVPTD